MRRTVFLVAAFLLGVTTRARAESRSLRIDYEAARTCPEERSFIELARERIATWATIDTHGELVAHVRAEEVGGHYVGRMSLEDAAGASLGSREIQEANCEEVVLALALFLAVALEADASHARDAAHARAGVSPRGAEADTPAPKSLPPSRSKESALASQLFARTHGVIGRTPDVTIGVALALDVGPRRGWSIVRPYGSLGIDVAPYSQAREGRGRVEVGWGAVFARACLGLDLTDPAWLEPWVCARGEVATLRAASRGYVVNRTEYLPAHALGGEAGAALRLNRAVSVGAFVHAMAPLVRNELVLGEQRVFRASAVTGEAGLELRVKIW